MYGREVNELKPNTVYHTPLPVTPDSQWIEGHPPEMNLYGIAITNNRGEIESMKPKGGTKMFVWTDERGDRHATTTPHYEKSALPLTQEEYFELNDTCMCGSPVRGHGLDDGHSPVSMFDHYYSEEKAKMSLNMSKAVFLVNDQVRAIKVAYNQPSAEEAKRKGVRLYSFKTLDPDLKPDNMVLVYSSTTDCGYAVGVVVEVDVEIDYDDNSWQMAWIVSKLDTTSIKDIEAKEREMLKTISGAEKSRRRNELREALLKDVPEPEKLAIVHQPEAPTPPPAAPKSNPGAVHPDDEIPF